LIQPLQSAYNPSNVLQFLITQTLLQKIPNWLNESTVEDKKGLRVIHAILVNKGNKRFKPRARNEQTDDLYQSYAKTSPENFQQFSTKFHYKYNSVSRYSQDFGKLDHKDNIVAILKYKQFSDLYYSVILSPTAKIYIERWINLNDEDYYKSLVLSTIVSIYTKIKSADPINSTNSDKYRWIDSKQVIKQPRFDKLLSLFQKTEPKVVHMDGKAITYEDFRKKALCTAPATVKGDSVYNINAKERKLDFIRGNSKMTQAFCNASDLKTTTYMDNHKTLPIDYGTIGFGKNWIFPSCSGVVIPDPIGQSCTKQKYSTYHKDLNTFYMKSVTKSDMSSPSHLRTSSCA